MRINKLELFGFKSFPDRTAFEFGSGISCVVGPNGSGKSNVVDALRWVIGEQSARSLRGKDMSDVIFAGSAVRSPVGFAEVVLTLGVGDGEPFPGDFSRFEELEVGRRLYRDGTSEYLINKVKARRRDIVDLFLDTGVGANLYSFIAQGQVDRIVSQSPNDRRSLIDEAAGISRYKIRREEALVRLQATATQLDRAADVADEMGRRLRTLQRQVLRAGRFRRMRARIRQREIALGVVKYSALSGDRRAYRARLRKLKDQVGALERSIERVETDLHTREEEVEAVRGAVSTWRDQAAELEAVRREKEGAASLHRSRHDELMAEVARADARIETARARIEAATEQRAGLTSEREAAEQALGGLPLEGLAAEHGRLAGEVERRRRLWNELVAAASGVAAKRRSLEEALQRLQDPDQAPLAEVPVVDGAKEQVAQLEARLAGAEREEVELRQASAVEKERVRGLRAEVDAAQQAFRASDRAWEQAQRQAQKRQRALLEDTRRRIRSAQEGAKREEAAERQARLKRLQSWTGALRSHHHRVREGHKSWASSKRAEEKRHQRAQQQGLEARERQEVEHARTAVDRGPLEQSSVALKASDSAVQEARDRSASAQQTRASAASRVAALEAEWNVLEEQRSASVPEEWAGHPLFESVAAPDDPRRVARPDLVGLPMLQEADLRVAREGRGLWPTGTGWTIVADRAAAITHLQAHGPPVASRDGSIRVDCDGVVELGWDSSSRWSVVRTERVEAARVVERTNVEMVQAKQSLQRADLDRTAAQQAVEDARRSLASAQDAAAKAARERVRAAGVKGREESEARLAGIDAQLAQRLAAVDAAHEAVADLESAARAAAQTLETRERPFTSLARGALAAAWPDAVPERPAAPERVVVDEGPLVVAERALEAHQAALSQTRRQLEEARQALRSLERRRDAVLAELAAREADQVRRERERAELTARLASIQDVQGVEESQLAYEEVRDGAEAARVALAAAQEKRGALREAIAASRAQEDALRTQSDRALADRTLATEERDAATSNAEEALTASLSARELAEIQAVQRAEVMERLALERDRLSKLLEETTRVRASLEKNRQELQTSDTERTAVANKVSQLQLDIEGIRKRIGERYQVSLPGLLDRLGMRRELVMDVDEAVRTELIIGETVLEAVADLVITSSLLDDEDRIVEMVAELEELRTAIQKLGEVNLAAEGEYLELAERYDDLDKQRNDLEASVKSIRSAIAKMNRTCRERFRDAYDRVNEAFQLAYPQLVGGGDARLALTDEEDLLETGVDIFVRPPGKRLQNLTLLSGGEKAMTAIALLLAIFKVRPSPFCVLDEVDAPLDEANGSRFNAMIREMSSMSQFIVITHNRTTMECADVLYGVTMAAPGVSTLVSVALERGRT